MWYKSWFDSPYYHKLYRQRNSKEAAAFIDYFIKYLNPNVSEWILDLGCGKGRHSIYMNKLGFKVIGADISKQNIAYAKKFENEHLQFALHDMREPLKVAHFGMVVNLFTSFGYFNEMEENIRVLRAAHFNLKPKGKLLIDYLNIELLKDTLVEREVQEIEGLTFSIRRKIEKDVITKYIEVRDGDQKFHFEEHVKALNKPDFIGMLTKGGFDVLDIFGNYSLGQFNPLNSPRLILIARKHT
jgi:SAM-dependent methyltransferase